ncbi:MAG: porin [Sinimarinibacterium sp.]|jgi:phosphate-selective porin OprO/OprP
MKITGPTGLVVGTLLLGAQPAFAQSQKPTAEDLDQRIRILERKLELSQEEADKKAKDSAAVSASEKGFSIKKGDFELKLRGLFQTDARIFVDDDGAFNDTFLFRRLRPTFEGSLGKLVGFRLTPEFAGDAATVVDAYFDLKFSPAATLRAGKVKGPVSLERLQSGSAIAFIERGFPTELAPNRDIGVQLQGALFNSTFNYIVGYYNGVADGRDAATRDVDNRKEVGVRVFAEPFKNVGGALAGLGFGVGGTHGSQFGSAVGNGGVLPQYRTPGQNTFFKYATDVAANGDHTRVSPQAYWYVGAFGVLTEYIQSEQTVALADVEEGIRNTAWQVATSFVLTGEDASYRGVTKPSQPFTLGGEGWGAFELIARYGELSVDDVAFDAGLASINSSAREARSLGVGANWYLSPNVKVVLNYTQTEFDGGAAGGADRSEEKAVFARLQLAY